MSNNKMYLLYTGLENNRTDIKTLNINCNHVTATDKYERLDQKLYSNIAVFYITYHHTLNNN